MQRNILVLSRFIPLLYQSQVVDMFNFFFFFMKIGQLEQKISKSSGPCRKINLLLPGTCSGQ